MKISRIIAVIALSVCFTAVAMNVVQNSVTKEKGIDGNNRTAVITGHGPALPEEYVVRLGKIENRVGSFVATDTIKNGQFRFEIPVEDGMSVYSFMVDYHAMPNMNHHLYVTPGAQIEIEAMDNYSETWPVKSNVPEQIEYELFTNNNKELLKEFQNASMELSKKRNKEARQVCDSISKLIDLRTLEFLKTRPVSRVWLDKALKIAEFSEYNKIDTGDLKTMYANLDDSIKNSQIGRAIYGHLYPESPIGIGDKFPDTEFYDLDGNVHKLSDFQGKWCLVDFWAAGCGPCIQALPELHEIKEKSPDQIEVVSLSTDSESNWRKASERYHLNSNNWNEGKEDYGLFKRIGTGGFPTFLVVTPDGTIKDIWMGYSPGSPKAKMTFNMLPRGNTEYVESNGLRSISFPNCAANNTGRVLQIDRIDSSNEGTKVFFTFVHAPKTWIVIPQEAYLSDSKDTRYKAISSDGIVLGEELYPNSEGIGSFSITFEKIPEDINSINFYESHSDNAWSIEGIKLKP